MAQVKKTAVIGTREFFISGALIVFIGINQGALFFYRVKPALDLVAIVSPIPDFTMTDFILLGITLSFAVAVVMAILSFLAFKLIGSNLTIGRTFHLLGRSLYPWLIGLAPIFAATGSFFIPVDNLTKMIIIPWSFYLWGKNVKTASGLTSGQTAAGIMLAVGAFVFLLVIISFAVLLVVGYSSCLWGQVLYFDILDREKYENINIG